LLLSATLAVTLAGRVEGQQPVPRGTLRGHPTEVVALAFSPDGRMLVSGGMDGTLRLWEVATGRQRRVLEGHTHGAVASVGFSPDGRTIASGGVDGLVRLWGRDGKPLQALGGQFGIVHSVAFSPDGRRLAIGGDGPSGIADEDPRRGQLRIWATGEGTGRILCANGGRICSVTFSPDGRTLAAGDNGFGVTLWETATGKVRATLPPHRNTVWSVAFADGGRVVVSGSDDGTVRLWDMAKGRARLTLKQRPNTTAGIAVARGGRLLASVSVATVHFYDVASGKLVTSLGQGETIWSLAFSPDGRLLAVGGKRGILKLWDVAGLLK
jgi:WD40 repeat protein